MKVAFLDRDGTIIKDYPDEEWATKSTPEFFPKSIASLKAIQTKGYEIIIITNQYLINDGIITEQQYQRFNKKFIQKLEQEGVNIKAVFYCPHNDGDNCNCKKPKPGLILQALKKYPEIELDKSFFVGDSEVDIGIASYFDLPIYVIQRESLYSKSRRIEDLSDVVLYC